MKNVGLSKIGSKFLCATPEGTVHYYKLILGSNITDCTREFIYRD